MEAQQATRQAAAAAANQRQQQEEAQPAEEPAPEPAAAPETAAARGALDEAVEETKDDTERDTQRPPATTRRIAPTRQVSPLVAAPPTSSTDSLAAPSSASPKRLQFASGKDAAGEPPLVFPALYRVVRERGAIVWNAESASVVRSIPLGVVLFGHDLQTLTVAGNTSDYLKIPDGWVEDDAVLRVYDDLQLPTAETQ